MKQLTAMLLMTVLVLAGCAGKEDVRKTLEENPDIVFDVLQKNPEKLVETLNQAIEHVKKQAREKAQNERVSRRENEYKNPRQPQVDEKRAIFGPLNAPITIVEYSDFECPYCSRGYNTVKKVVKEYGDKVRVVYKHFPLRFHQMAEPSARYFEAIVLQDTEKAQKFHDAVFENQNALKSDKEAFLKRTAKTVGANMVRLKQDLNSDLVKERIRADMQEASKFGFTGTPGFLINGVALKGAQPYSEFKKIIDRHLAAQEK